VNFRTDEITGVKVVEISGVCVVVVIKCNFAFFVLCSTKIIRKTKLPNKKIKKFTILQVIDLNQQFPTAPTQRKGERQAGKLAVGVGWVFPLAGGGWWRRWWLGWFVGGLAGLVWLVAAVAAAVAGGGPENNSLRLECAGRTANGGLVLVAAAAGGGGACRDALIRV
jgi:hypothetical protein